MQYKCLRAISSNEGTCIQILEKQVNQYLDFSWKLQGGVSITSRTDTSYAEYVACQAMVKED